MHPPNQQYFQTDHRSRQLYKKGGEFSNKKAPDGSYLRVLQCRHWAVDTDGVTESRRVYLWFPHI